MTTYFLITSRLGFRHWNEADLPLARVLWVNHEVTVFLGGPFSEEQIEKRLHREISSQREHGIQYWPVFVLNGELFAGCAGLRPYNLQANVFEIGVHLLPLYWRQGFGEEAARAVIDYAFTTTSASALFAGHHPRNPVSPKLLAKLGFRYTHEELYQPTGEMHRHICCVVRHASGLRSFWLNRLSATGMSRSTAFSGVRLGMQIFRAPRKTAER